MNTSGVRHYFAHRAPPQRTPNGAGGRQRWPLGPPIANARDLRYNGLSLV
jgi:hypothetical protein